jgi:two-component system sensor histidine kinase DesK
LCACAYAPIGAFGIDWSHLQWFVVASSAMLLPRPLAVVGVLGPTLGTTIAVVLTFVDAHAPVPMMIVWGGYYLAIMGMGAAALYWAARLARLLDELYAARTELAELAVGRERLRVSRDLHDLLGHSLSAVSLKGDLALRLLPDDPAAAQAEIAGLTGVARSALRDMRAVARDEHVVSLRAELDAAVAVLDAAGAAAHVSVDVGALPPSVEVVLAWAVREGATNILRHSTAGCCSFVAVRQPDGVRLEIVNDGASSVAAAGSGLAGLAERARAVGGSALGGIVGAGEFRLVVEVPA